MRSRRTVLLIAIGVIAASAILAATVHLLLGFLVLQIAAGPPASFGTQATSALVRIFAAEHPRVRVRAVPEPSLAAVARALDDGTAQLAVVRSDVAPQIGQTLVILRRDAIVFLAPSEGALDGIAKLHGHTIGVLSEEAYDAKLLDLILEHYEVAPASVRRKLLAPDQVMEAVRRREVAALFVIEPASGSRISTLLTAVRKAGRGQPHVLAVDEAAAIAKRYPELETLDVPKGSFDGSIPAPDDDITTLSVSYRLAARAAMPDAIAAEVTRVVLSDKPKLMALDPTLVGVDAPDTDDKTPALPIHSGAAGYLTGNQPSLSDQAHNAIYWLGLMTSLAASTTAAGLAVYHRLRSRPPLGRVLRLLQIWRSARSADVRTLKALEGEADDLLHASVRAHADGQAEDSETPLLSLVLPHVREAFRQRRTALADSSSGDLSAGLARAALKPAEGDAALQEGGAGPAPP